MAEQCYVVLLNYQGVDMRVELDDLETVITKCLNDYGPENTFLSFNGGKDCTVLQHLVQIAIRKKYPDLNHKLLCLYVKSDNTFREQKCVEYPKNNCHILSEEINSSEEALEVSLKNQITLLNAFKNITHCDEFNLTTKYIDLQETYQEPQFKLVERNQRFEDLKKDCVLKTETLTKHLEENLQTLYTTNSKKSLELQTQVELEKAEFEKKETQFQVDLETLEDATAFRQEIMETDLTKQLVELNATVNQLKSTNSAIKKEIETLRTNLITNVTTFNMPETTGMITPEMMSLDLLQYSNVPNSNEKNMTLSPQIFNTININLNNIGQGNYGTTSCTITKPKTSDINVKRATVADMPQNKKSATGGKYMPLAVSMPKNKPTTEFPINKRQHNKGHGKKNSSKNSEEILKQITVKVDEPTRRKKRKLYNPDLNLKYLRALEDEEQ